MNICIFASIWAQNLGDELIIKNEIQLLEQEFWADTRFKIATYNIQDIFYTQKNIQYFEYFPLWIKNPKNIFRNIKNLWIFYKNIIWSDIVVIWGGWIIYDSEIQSVWNPLNQWIFRANIARLFWKKLYFYALWIDIKDTKNTKKLKNIFKNAFKITVRDTHSQKQLSYIWMQSELVDDPVMSDSFAASFSSGRERIQDWVVTWNNILWTHLSKTFQISDLKHYDFSEKKVWLALRSWYFWDSLAAAFLLKRPQCPLRIENWMRWAYEEKKLITELCEYIESQWGAVVFLPHSFHESDAIANDHIFLNQFLTEAREIKISMQEVYDVYTKSQTDLNITMRLHSIILSHVYEIPQIVLSYSLKTDEVIKKLKK